MPRSFRIVEKKRGHRRTGSSKAGTAGEALFFSILLLLGIGGLVAFFALLVVPEWRVNYEFVEHTCKVLDRHIAETKGPEGTLYRPEIQIEYEIDGVRYVQWTYDIATIRDLPNSYSTDRQVPQDVLDGFVIYTEQNKQQYYCWYDPTDPDIVVLVRGYSWWIWVILVVPVSFILIGAGGVIYALLHWGTSAERRAVIVQRAAGRELFETNGDRRREYPNIPDSSNITNSPGTTLTYRLPIGTSTGWMLFGTALACVLWNGVVAVFVIQVIGGHLDGEPDWLLTLFVVPFVLVGIALLFALVRQMLVTTGIGPTLVEISEHPLRPGGQYRLLVSQSGQLRVNSFEVSLVCEEKATYRQGTDTRTETREVCQRQVLHREEFEVQRGLPFEAECELTIPESAMHSFKADYNEVAWRVVVKGDVAGWPDYQREFPVIVHPHNGSSDT